MEFPLSTFICSVYVYVTCCLEMLMPYISTIIKLEIHSISHKYNPCSGSGNKNPELAL